MIVARLFVIAALLCRVKFINGLNGPSQNAKRGLDALVGVAGVGDVPKGDGDYIFSYYPSSAPNEEPTIEGQPTSGDRPSSTPNGQPTNGGSPSGQPTAGGSPTVDGQPTTEGSPSSAPNEQPSANGQPTAGGSPSSPPNEQPTGNGQPTTGESPSTAPNGQPTNDGQPSAGGDPSSAPNGQPSSGNTDSVQISLLPFNITLEGSELEGIDAPVKEALESILTTGLSDQFDSLESVSLTEEPPGATGNTTNRSFSFSGMAAFTDDGNVPTEADVQAAQRQVLDGVVNGDSNELTNLLSEEGIDANARDLSFDSTSAPDGQPTASPGTDQAVQRALSPFNITFDGEAGELDEIGTPVKEALESILTTGLSEQFGTLDTVSLTEESSDDTGNATSRSFSFSGMASFTDNGTVPTEAEVQAVQRQVLDGAVNGDSDELTNLLSDDGIGANARDLSFDSTSAPDMQPTATPSPDPTVQRALSPFSITFDGEAGGLNGIDAPVKEALESILMTGLSEQFGTLDTVSLTEEPSDDTGNATSRSFSFSGMTSFTDDGNVPTEAEVQAVQRQVLDGVVNGDSDELTNLLSEDGFDVNARDLSFEPVSRSLLPFNITLDGEEGQLNGIDAPVKAALESILKRGLTEQFETLEAVSLTEEPSENTGNETSRAFSFSGSAAFTDDGNVPTEEEVQAVQRELLDGVVNGDSDELTNLLGEDGINVTARDLSFGPVPRALLPFNITLGGDEDQLGEIDAPVKEALESILTTGLAAEFGTLEMVSLAEEPSVDNGIPRSRSFSFSGMASFANDGNVPTEPEVQAVQKQLLDAIGNGDSDELVNMLNDDGISVNVRDVSFGTDGPSTAQRDLLPFEILLEGSANELNAIDTPLRETLESILTAKTAEQVDSLQMILLFEEPSEDTGVPTSRSYSFSGVAQFTNDGNVPSQEEVYAIQREILDALRGEDGDELQQALEANGILVDVRDITFNSGDGDRSIEDLSGTDSYHVAFKGSTLAAVTIALYPLVF
eukprot:scaffold1034_cov127-Cylindrotheca_fusiformis.AAC.14